MVQHRIQAPYLSTAVEQAVRKLQPAKPMRLDALRQIVRSTTLRRGREVGAWIALGGTLAAMCFAAYQVQQGWNERRRAAENAVRDHLATAAVLIGTEAARMSGLELRALLWPALGTNGFPNSRVLSLDAFAAAGAAIFPAMSDDRGEAQPGYFRLVRGGDGEWSAQLAGAFATDSAYADVVMADVRSWAAKANLDRPGARIGIIHPTVRGAPFIVAMAPERREDGRAGALFGVAYARQVALRMHVRHVLRGVSLLPAPVRASADVVQDSATKVDNSALSVRIVHANGFRDDVASGVASGVEAGDSWKSQFAASRGVDGPDGGFAVEVAMPETIGKRYVAESMPTTSERLMLGGVLLLGIGFVGAAGFALRRQYKLAEARRMFVAAVSHELRTPLAHVNALSETLMLGRAESPEQAQRWLKAIHREGRRLSVLTENVLLHARGERRGIRAAPQWTDVGAVVRDAVSLVEAQAQARSARIVVEESALNRQVPSSHAWVDAAALRQIVINFVENALKFGPERQTVTVRLDLEAPAGDAASSGLLRLSVIDHGPGVPHTDRERIWKPFVRLVEGGTAPTGTGLGLSVVRQLVDEMNGRWSVRNEPGRGARFTVEIPLAANAPLSAASSRERTDEHADSLSVVRSGIASCRR